MRVHARPTRSVHVMLHDASRLRKIKSRGSAMRSPNLRRSGLLLAALIAWAGASTALLPGCQARGGCKIHTCGVAASCRIAHGKQEAIESQAVCRLLRTAAVAKHIPQRGDDTSSL